MTGLTCLWLRVAGKMLELLGRTHPKLMINFDESIKGEGVPEGLPFNYYLEKFNKCFGRESLSQELQSEATSVVSKTENLLQKKCIT